MEKTRKNIKPKYTLTHKKTNQSEIVNDKLILLQA